MQLTTTNNDEENMEKSAKEIPFSIKDENEINVKIT